MRLDVPARTADASFGPPRRDVGIGSPVSPVGERSLWRDVDTSRRSGDAGPAVAVARELSLSNGGECWADLDAVAPPEVPGDAGARVGAHAQGSWRGREAAELEAELRVVMRALELERTRGDKEAARAREVRERDAMSAPPSCPAPGRTRRRVATRVVSAAGAHANRECWQAASGTAAKPRSANTPRALHPARSWKWSCRSSV